MILSFFYRDTLSIIWLFLRLPWILFIVFTIVLSRMAYCVDLVDIIRNVRSNEQLYKNMDLAIYDEYTDVKANLDAQENFLPIMQQTVEIKYVKQDGMFHLSVEGTAQRKTSKLDKETVARNKIRLFDGNTSRVLQGKKANIVAGFTLDSNMISPHMLILQPCGYPVPLSTYMEGHRAMQTYKDLNWDPKIHIQTEFLGEETVETHVCQKVSLKHIISTNNYVHSAWILWLALDRNYIPIQCEAYTYSASKSLPVGRSISRDLREIAPGVWFPSEVVYTAYNSNILREHQRQEVAWRERYTIKTVSLAPHYPISFFRDLKIPNSTYVYHINANNKIKQSYVQGAPGESDTHRVSSQLWLFWGGVLTLIACSITLFVRRRRYRGRAAIG